MSQLIEIKAIIFSNLKVDNEKLKGAIFDVFEAIDEDLDVGNYEPSSLVEEALVKFNAVLKEQDDEDINSELDTDSLIDELNEEEVEELIKNESVSIHDDDDENE